MATLSDRRMDGARGTQRLGAGTRRDSHQGRGHLSVICVSCGYVRVSAIMQALRLQHSCVKSSAAWSATCRCRWVICLTALIKYRTRIRRVARRRCADCSCYGAALASRMDTSNCQPRRAPPRSDNRPGQGCHCSGRALEIVAALDIEIAAQGSSSHSAIGAQVEEDLSCVLSEKFYPERHHLHIAARAGAVKPRDCGNCSRPG